MLECQNCFKSVNINSTTCDHCGYHLPKNKKSVPKYDESKNRIFNLPVDKSIVTTKEWLLLFLILCIPFINLFIIYKYGFREKQESNIKYFLRAIGIILLIILGFNLIKLFFNIIESLL